MLQEKSISWKTILRVFAHAPTPRMQSHISTQKTPEGSGCRKPLSNNPCCRETPFRGKPSYASAPTHPATVPRSRNTVDPRLETRRINQRMESVNYLLLLLNRCCCCFLLLCCCCCCFFVAVVAAFSLLLMFFVVVLLLLFRCCWRGVPNDR